MSAERQPQGPENSVEAPKVTAEQYEALAEKTEKKAERAGEAHNAERDAEKARAEIDTAIKVEAGSAEKEAKQPKASAAPRRGAPSKKEKAASFKKEMDHVQSQLPAGQRAFSKVIHAPVVEKASEVVGSTIARPNAILSGAFVAFILVLAVYLIAKNFGYVLSGFETIGAFIVGWVLGVLYDYFRVLITGKKS